jgi:LacI family transcriptional regulator
MVTIKDVAREAGVSVASVSRALNGTGEVTDEIRRRVETAAKRLKYVPDRAAQMLITRSTRTIGVLLPDLHGEFFSELIRGIDAAARSRGLHLLVSSSHGNVQEAAVALKSMMGRVDGVLVMSPHVDGRVLRRILPRSIPGVLMNTHDRRASLTSVSIDNFGGAFAVTEHLLRQGYGRIAHVAGPDGNFDAQERLRGYQEALAQHAHRKWEWLVRGEFTEESGYRAAREILALSERPDAVFAANDAMALGCLFAFNEANVRVPRDVALAGFDDIPIARFVTPPLTTVRVNTSELGARALDRLAVEIEQGGAARRSGEVLATELVVRASTGTGDVVRPTQAAIPIRRARKGVPRS